MNPLPARDHAIADAGGPMSLDTKFDSHYAENVFHLVDGPNYRTMDMADTQRLERDQLMEVQETACNTYHVEPGVKEILSCASAWMEWKSESNVAAIRIHEAVDLTGEQRWTGRVLIPLDTNLESCIRVILYVKFTWSLLMKKLCSKANDTERFMDIQFIKDQLANHFEFADPVRNAPIKLARSVGDHFEIIESGNQKPIKIRQDSIVNASPEKVFNLCFDMPVSRLLPMERREASVSKKPCGGSLSTIPRSLAATVVYAALSPFIIIFTMRRMESMMSTCERCSDKLDDVLTGVGAGLRKNAWIRILRHLVAYVGLWLLFISLFLNGGGVLGNFWSICAVPLNALILDDSDVTNVVGRQACKVVAVRDLLFDGWQTAVLKLFDRSAVWFTFNSIITLASAAQNDGRLQTVSIVTVTALYAIVLGLETIVCSSLPSVIFTHIRMLHGTIIQKDSYLAAVAYESLDKGWRRHIKETVLCGPSLSTILGTSDVNNGRTSYTHFVIDGGIYRKMMPLHVPKFVRSLKGIDNQTRVEIETVLWNDDGTCSESMASIINITSRMDGIKTALSTFVGRELTSLSGYQTGSTLRDQVHRLQYVDDRSGNVAIVGDCALIWSEKRVKSIDAISSAKRVMGIDRTACLTKIHADHLANYREKSMKCTVIEASGHESELALHPTDIYNDSCINPRKHLKGVPSWVPIICISRGDINVQSAFVG